MTGLFGSKITSPLIRVLNDWFVWIQKKKKKKKKKKKTVLLTSVLND